MELNFYALIPDLCFIGGKTVSGFAVVIKDGRIVSVCEEAALPAGISFIKLRDGTLLPGFIDAHVHAEKWQLPLYLAHGITSVRDTGNDLEYIMELKNSASVPGAHSPYIFSCGPLLDCACYSHENISWGMPSAEDIEEAVKVLAFSGYEAIKLYAGLDLPILTAGIRAAKKEGIRAIAHIEDSRLLAMAVKEGIDETEHIAGSPLPFDPAFADEVYCKSAACVPTQSVFEEVLNRHGQGKDHSEYISYLPDNLKKYWLSYAGTVSSNPEKTRYYCLQHREYLKYMICKGVMPGVGTDAPCQWSMPGKSYLTELKAFISCGMSNSEALQCATSVNASLPGISSRKGNIKEGMDADLVFVGGDPCENISCAGNILRIYRGGIEYRPDELLEEIKGKKPVSDSLRNFGGSFTERTDWRKSSLYRKYINDKYSIKNS